MSAVQGRLVKIFEGVLLEVESGIYIEAGDTYIARRNTGWKLLTCKEHRKEDGYVIPVESEYPYNTNECLRVVRGIA